MSYDQTFVCSYNPGENILNKVEKSKNWIVLKTLAQQMKSLRWMYTITNHFVWSSLTFWKFQIGKRSSKRRKKSLEFCKIINEKNAYLLKEFLGDFKS